MKKHPIKTHPMWNPSEPTYADVGDVVGKAFAAGLRPDPVEEPVSAERPSELLEILVGDTLRQHLDALIPIVAREIAQRLR